MRVYSFYVADITVFKHLSLPSHKSLEPLSTQITISLKPHHFQAKSLQNLFKVCVSNTIFIFYFWIMQNLCLGFWKLGTFQNWVGILIFVKIFSISWLGFVPFGVYASVLAPCGNSNMYWGIFSLCSCIFHHCCALLHARCLTECSSDILWLCWIQMSSFT